MPYQWIKPELVFSYFGVSIFRTYRHEFYVDPYQYNFTTCDFNDKEDIQFDARELGEWHKYIAAHGKIKEDGTYENHMHNVIKMAIERQTLIMPVPDADYPVKRGCFNWYDMHPHGFIRNITDAAISADFSNKARLGKIYPHIIKCCSSTEGWDTAHHGDVTDAPILPVFRDSSKEPGDHGNGCFFWYLNRSGSFVTNMANVILHADIKNLEIIRMVYPQMVAAYECGDWNITPMGFKPIYDAGPG